MELLRTPDDRFAGLDDYPWPLPLAATPGRRGTPASPTASGWRTSTRGRAMRRSC
ncbi:MAG: hypothetical protein KKA97_03345 [Actinobacteria bacterium]|nr:hypothetical protein [Actinomycetota bacterium]